ncbi:MAG: adenylate/guanylate cyclase domain-containing protein [Solirubrobacterales bacterium]
MTESSRIRYVRSGDPHIAYRTFGSGEHDLLLVLPTVGTIEMLGEQPAVGLAKRIGKFCRMISFDRRGLGLSDPVGVPATLEEQVEDIDAVLDAAGTRRVAIMAEAEGTMMAVMYAATHPERVSHLVLLHPLARVSSAPGYEWTWTEAERLERFVRPQIERWGTGEAGEGLAPVLAARDPRFIEWFGRWERLSASPGVVAEAMELSGKMDVREILPQVQAPTLVLNRTDALAFEDRHAAYAAEHIPGAELRELPGRDVISIGDGVEELCDAIEEFVCEHAPMRAAERALSTVLFTDVVGSTERAAELGDKRWRELLELHDRITREQVGRFGGRAIKSTGDGFLASFDGPARAVRCALELGERLRSESVEIRAGLHTGEVELMEDDIGGMAVHIGARIADLAEGGEVLASSTVRDLVVGSGIEFAERGSRQLKGVPGQWTLVAAVADGPEAR